MHVGVGSSYAARRHVVGVASAAATQGQRPEQRGSKPQPNPQNPSAAGTNHSPTCEQHATGSPTGDHSVMGLSRAHARGVCLKGKGVSRGGGILPVVVYTVRATARLARARPTVRAGAVSACAFAPSPKRRGGAARGGLRCERSRKVLPGRRTADAAGREEGWCGDAWRRVAVGGDSQSQSDQHSALMGDHEGPAPPRC